MCRSFGSDFSVYPSMWEVRKTDTLDELIQNYIVTLDSALFNDSEHLKATMKFHDYLEHELSAEKSAKIEEIVGKLTSATFNAGVKVGLRLGARIAVGLIADKS